MQSKYSFTFKMIAVSAFVVFASSTAFADGDDRYVPRKRAAAAAPAPAPVYTPAPVVMREAPPAVVQDESCGCGNVRVSGGVPVHFFSEESNLPMAGAALDYWCDEIPLNFRVGVEGRHMYLGQNAADFAREFDDKTTRVTFIRIPFAVEYMTEIAKATTGFIGAGPDIIHTANDITETSVGMHVSGRLHYAFDEHFGVSLEAGYMWASVDGQGDDHVVLNSAFVSPMLAYTF